MNTLLRATVMVLLLASQEAGAAEFLVVQSNTAAFPLGAKMRSGDEIHTLEGQRVVLLRDDGMRTTLEGEATTLLEGASTAVSDGSLLRALEKLLDTHDEGDNRLGGTRGISASALEQARRLGIQIDRPGDYCVDDAQDTMLWRGFDDLDEEVSIATMANPEELVVHWRQGESFRSWPEQLPLTDGGRYRISIIGIEQTLELRVLLVPDGLATQAHIAAWMANAGCTSQARRVLQHFISE